MHAFEDPVLGNRKVTLVEIAAYLDSYFQKAKFEEIKGDPYGIYQTCPRPIQRIGLILEPWNGLKSWVISQQLDAVFCHRPWHLPLDQLSDVGILAYHLAFDQGLTIGYNPHLATALNLTDLEVLGTKAGSPVGMLGTVPSQDLEKYAQQVAELFSGLDCFGLDYVGTVPLSKVAVVGAMTADLIQEAAIRQVQLYLTGQVRPAAQAAVRATGINLIAVGHERAERWGLSALAALLQIRWPALEIVLQPE